MAEVSTIGLDIAKQVFQAAWRGCSGRVVFRKKITPGEADRSSSHPSRGAWWRWRRVVVRIIGGARSAKLGHDGTADTAGLRQAVRQAAEERCGRCRSDLRGSAAAEHAVRGGEERGAAGERAWCSAPVICWCGSGRSASTPCAGIWPSMARSRPRDGARRARWSLLIEDPTCAVPRECARRVHGADRAASGHCDDADRRAGCRDRPPRREDPVARRLMTIPGIGPITATAITALAPAPESFRTGGTSPPGLG